MGGISGNWIKLEHSLKPLEAMEDSDKRENALTEIMAQRLEFFIPGVFFW